MEEGVDDDATEGKIIFGFFFFLFLIVQPGIFQAILDLLPSSDDANLDSKL